jgi:hypothetical protein
MTATPVGVVAGQVLYYSNAAPVGGVAIQVSSVGQGLTIAPAQTDVAGRYSVAGLGVGSWQIQPQKVGDTNAGISALDAVYVLEAQSGGRTLSAAQQLACDVTGNGTVSVLDAALILQYKVGIIAALPVAQACGSDWAFLPLATASSNEQIIQPRMVSGSCQPGAVILNSLTGQVSGQDFSAVLFGDCTGNWQPSAGSGATLIASSTHTAVRLGRAQRHGRRFRVPVAVQTGKSFQALDVQITYDPNQLDVRGILRTGNARNALVQANTNVPGRIVISLASTTRLSDGPVLLLEFAATHARAGTGSLHLTHATVE